MAPDRDCARSAALPGYRVWPGVFLGAFLANLTTAGTVATSLGIALGNTLEGLIAAYLVTRFANGANFFRRASDVLRFALLAAVVSTVLSATIGVASLAVGGFARWADYWRIWFTWWLGDAGGALIVTPLIVLWVADPRVRWNHRRLVEGVLLWSTMVLMAGIVFEGRFPYAYPVVPFLSWAALRFGPRETATASVLVSAIAIWGTLHGAGPFSRAATPHERLLLLQMFTMAMALVHLPFAALFTEGKDAEERLRNSEQRFRAMYERERSVAELLQRTLLPGGLPDIPGLRIASRYVPAAPEPLGGDWYDVLPLPDGKVGLAMGDVAGRGVEAAVAMGRLRSALRAYVLEGHPPRVVAQRLNRLLGAEEMASLCYMVLDAERWQLEFVNAGHPPPVVVARDGSSTFLEAASLPLGTPLQRGYDEQSVTLPPDSTLLLYTDGLIEARRESVEVGLRRLERIVRLLPPSDPNRLIQGVLDGILGESTPVDDIALLALAAAPVDPSRFRMELPAVPTSLATLRYALRRWLTAVGASPDAISRIMVAVGEGATNAVEHAYGPADGTFIVEATVDQRLVRLTVRDRGRWLDRDGTTRGVGLKLMKSLADSAEIVRSAEGTTVHLSLHLDGGA